MKGLWFDKSQGRWVVVSKKGTFYWANIVYKNFVLNGKEIPEGYVVHHINGDRTDDAPENLELMTKEQHASLHRTGQTHSQEAKDKIGAGNVLSHLGVPLSPEHIEKRTLGQRGLKRSPETKARMSEARKQYYELHPEAKEKQSEAQKGKKRSQETCDRISKAKQEYYETHKTIKHTQEAKDKISQSKKGKKQSSAHVEANRQAHIGQVRSPEAIEKTRQKMIGRKNSPEHIELAVLGKLRKQQEKMEFIGNIFYKVDCLKRYGLFV